MKSRDSELQPDPERVEELFHAAAEVPTADQADFLAHACGQDARLQETICSLLAAKRHASAAWELTALELEAKHIAFESMRTRPGDFFGSYRILRRIATGGMSAIYEALRDDAEFQKRVAIKLVLQGISNAAGVERFRSERQILAQLEHPYIARLLDGGTTDDGIPYLVMEYVDGIPIDRFVSKNRFSRTERLKLFLQVCEAVQYAHRNLVVHRDLKPGNILVTSEGAPKLLDFGIAKILTAPSNQTTVRALTLEYASPEQVLGHSIGTATDVYSLGVLLFVVLADRLPYRATAQEPADLVRAICEEEPVWEPAGLIHGDLYSILAQALNKEPERRYLSVEQLAADVQRYLEGLPVLARPNSFFYRTRKFVARRAVPLAAAALLLVAILVGAFSTLAQSRRVARRFNEVRSLAHSVLFDIYDSIGALPGSLPARRLVAGHAQRYLDSLVQEASDDSALALDLAESYLRLGDVRGFPYAANLGDTQGALESYRKARELLEREANRHPDDPAIQERLSRVYMNLGRVLARQRAPDSAAATLRQSIAIGEALIARYPNDLTYREKLSQAYLYLGEAQSVMANRARSLAAYQQVLDTYRKALAIQEATGVRSDEAWQGSLAKEYFAIGYAFWGLGDFTGQAPYYHQALEIQLKGQQIYRALETAHPERPQQRAVADGVLTVGLTRWKCCRDLEGAMRDFREARQRFQTIADADPSDMEAQRDIANLYDAIGRALGEAGHKQEALVADRKALAIYEQLGRSDPASGENADFAAATSSRIAALLRSISY